ncbi:Ig-like domain-containing protein, partial [Plasticicumulans acidivorans]
ADRLGADLPANPVTQVGAGSGTPGTAVAAGTDSSSGSSVVGSFGTLTLGADGSYRYVLDTSNASVNALPNGQTLADIFSYTITDADGDSSTTTLTITVTSVNDAPVAVDDHGVTDEDTPLQGNVIANDGDIDSPRSELSVQSFSVDGDARVYGPGETATIPGIGTLRIDADGQYLFTPAHDYSGPVPTVTYTLSDGGLSDTATLSIDVRPVADTPRLDVTAPPTTSAAGTIPLTIDTGVTDTVPNDLGSEHVDSVTLSGLPSGSVLRNAAGETFVVNGDTLTLTPAQLPGLSLTPPPLFSGSVQLEVTATAVDGSSRASSTRSIVFMVPGRGVALNDTPTTPPAAGDHDSLSRWLQPQNDPFRLTGSTDYGSASPYAYQGMTLPQHTRDADGNNYELYLSGDVRDQVMIERRPSSFALSRAAFRHTDPAEHLSFEAIRPDGRPLPAWLNFDRESLRFWGVPPRDFDGLDIVVIARDSYGHHVTVQFHVYPETQSVLQYSPLRHPAAAEKTHGPRTAEPAATPAPQAPAASVVEPTAPWLAALLSEDRDAAVPPAEPAAAAGHHGGLSEQLQRSAPKPLGEHSRELAALLNTSL